MTRGGPILPGPCLAIGAGESVWDKLSAQLADGDLMAANQRVNDHVKDHEIDFVVAIEGHGIVAVEVKGGEVWHDGNNWYQQRRDGGAVIHPVRQAREGCYALRSYVEADPRWTQDRLASEHVVVFPHSSIPDDFALPDCPRWKIVDRDQLDGLVGLLWAVFTEATRT